MFQLIAVSLVVMGLSHTIARERLFAPLRDHLGGQRTWFGYLVSCPYCVSHWVALVLVPVTGTYAIEVRHDWGPVTWLLRWFLSSILVAVIAAFFRIGFYFVDQQQGLIRHQQKAVELDVELARQKLDGEDEAAGRSNSEHAEAATRAPRSEPKH
jgi:hypothetical protein